MMRALETAFGLPLGRSHRPALEGSAVQHPRDALESLLLPALQRPPCLVAFSGGRDSSALLAVAATVARREGLPAPIPVTARFPEVASTDECAWQEQMIRHTGLSDWERVELTDELDLVGPYAQCLLLEAGNLFAFNAHFSAPLVERARGGTLVTGVGGDEIFGMSRWRRVAALRDGSRSPAERTLGRVLSASPKPLRRWALRDQLDADRSWLTGPAARRSRREWTRWVASHPVARDRALRRWLWPSRYWQLARDSLSIVGALWGARLLSPFMEPEFIDAAAHRMGPAGFASQPDAIAALLGSDVLPEPIRRRRTKATFDLVFFNRHSRAFVERWDGSGVAGEIVDSLALRREWQRRPRPDARSYPLIKAAWLAEHFRSSAASCHAIESAAPRSPQTRPSL